MTTTITNLSALAAPLSPSDAPATDVGATSSAGLDLQAALGYAATAATASDAAAASPYNFSWSGAGDGTSWSDPDNWDTTKGTIVTGRYYPSSADWALFTSSAQIDDTGQASYVFVFSPATLTVGGTITAGNFFDGGQVGVTGQLSVSGSERVAFYIGESTPGSLTVEAGGSLNIANSSSRYAALDIGLTGAGTLTVTGAGAKASTTNPISIGGVSKGYLNILAGGSMTAITNYPTLAAAVGLGAPFNTSVGYATISGAGSVLNVGAGGLGIGDVGRGTLVISQGGQLILSSSANLFLANGASAKASVTVTDPGSKATLSGALNVANVGTATLAIENHGTVSVTGSIAIGRNAGGFASVAITSAGVLIGHTATIGNAGTAAVSVSGSSSTLQLADSLYVGESAAGWGTVTAVNGGSIGVGGNVTIGNSGHAFVTVGSGGSVSSHDAMIAFGTNSYGLLTVYGQGSTLNTNGSELDVGVSAMGKMFVAQQGSVSAGSAFIGGTPQDGSAAGTGQLQILSGGTLSSTQAFIGGAAGQADGQVTVSGTGSLWTLGTGQSAGGVVIGQNGRGSLYVGAGGTVNAGYVTVGDQLSVSNSRLTVGGTAAGAAPAILTASGNVIVGNSGFAAAVIQNVAQVTATGTTTLGANGDSEGTLTVQGTLASWQNTGAVTIGGGGMGVLTVNAGQFSVGGGNGVTVGAGSGANASGSVTIQNQGTLTGTGIDLGMAQGAVGTGLVTGNHSTWSDIGSGNLTVGDQGSGTLTIASGGTVAVGGSIDIGANAGVSNGEVTLTGVGSVLTDQQDHITIGDAGTGALYIIHGAQFSAPNEDVVVGNKDGSTGVLLVNGAGSQVTIGGTLTLGQNGTTALLAGYGASVQVSGDLDTAAKAGSYATAFLIGQGTTGTIGGDLNVGLGGVSNFSLSDAAAAYVTGAITVGGSASARGSIHLNGAGTKLVSGSGAVTIGDSGLGIASVQNGALFDASSSDVTVGDQQGSSGYLEIDGNGTQFDAASLTVSSDSTGKQAPADDGTPAPDTGLQFQLDLSAGATLSVAGDMTVGENAGSSGNVSVTDPGSALSVGGDLVVGDGGKGLFEFDGGSAAVNGNATFGAQKGASGKLTIAVGDVKVDGTLTLGEGGSGAATVNVGGALDANDMELGDSIGSSGKLTVDGSGTTVEAESMSVGGGGAGSVGLTNGADLQTMGDVSIGEAVTTGTDSISLNEQSSWSDGGALDVGDSGSAQVVAKAGSAITVAGDLTLAVDSDETGLVTITGTGAVASSLLYGGALVIGEAGAANFTVSSGGIAGPASGAPGTVDIAASGGAGNLVVTGAGSRFAAGALAVGGTGLAAGGKGSVTVASGGAVTASSLTLWGGSKAVVTGGTLDDTGALGGTGAVTIASHGVVEIGGPAAKGGSITFADGTGTLDLSDAALVATTIKGFQTGDSINLAGLAANGDSFSGNKLTLTDGGTTVATLALSGPYKTGEFSLTPSGNGVALTVAFSPTKSDPPKTIATSYGSGIALTAYNYYNPLSIASTGAITATSGSAVYGDASQAWTVANSGTVAATGGVVGDNGVYLAAGGTVANNAGASISGYSGVYVTGGSGTVANSGTIAATGTGAAAFGVYLGAGGYVGNGTGGTIAGGMTGIALGAYGTVANKGAITARPNGRGVVFAAGGVLANLAGGAVSGYDAVALGAAGSVANSGTITALGPAGVGVSLAAGGTLTNTAAGAITGYTAVYAGGPATVANQGTIAGHRAGIYLGAGGLATNGTAAGSAASVTGYGYGIVAAGAPLTLTNYGTVAASGSAGVGVVLDAGSTLVNAGAIVGASGTAVSLGGGDSLIVGSGARFTGAIAGFGSSDTIVLTGVDATGYGYAGGVLTLDNGAATVARLALTTVYARPRFILAYQGGATTVTVTGALHPATLSGDYRGGIILGTEDAFSPLTITGTVDNTVGAAVYGSNYAAWTVTNLGTVVSNPAGIGIELSVGGLVTNGDSAASSAYVAGYAAAIEIAGARGTVVNAGTVAATGTAGTGVDLPFGGTFDNAAGGKVSGAYGVRIADGGTVTNAGVITGLTAVSFNGGADALVIEQGSTISGAVAGFVAGDTIDFAHQSGTSVSFSYGVLSLMAGGAPIASVDLSGTFAAGEFAVASDGSGGTDVTFSADPTQAQLTTTSDFTGDGMSDVLWQNDNAQDSGSGQTAVWLMDGVNPSAEDIITTVPTSWHVIGTGDFYGTGDAAILWQNDDGQAGIWEMNGTNPTAETVFASPPPSWHMIATGDFNGDGMSDVLWQYEDTGNSSDSQNGNVAIWEMNGASAIAAAVVAQPGPDWDVIGTGDFNGDGKSDILWQYEDSQNASDPQNGNVAIWEMNGLTPIASAVIAQPGPDWHVVGTGDFNGDGKADILWQYEDTANSSDPQNGNVAIWEMNGLTPIASAVVAQPGSAWHAIGTGDYDGNGQSDILWQNTDGQAAIWLMNGLTPTTESVFAAPPSSWHVIPA